MAAKSVAIASLWKQRTGVGQDIQVDIRKALKRLSPFYEKKWETVNGFGLIACVIDFLFGSAFNNSKVCLCALG